VDPFHQQLARIAFDASDDLGLVLAGGYAISAHHLTSRPSRDLDFATVSTLPLDVITDRLASVYRGAGYDVQVIETAPTMARFELHRLRFTLTNAVPRSVSSRSPRHLELSRPSGCTYRRGELGLEQPVRRRLAVVGVSGRCGVVRENRRPSLETFACIP
jgi:hypothetical protein